MPYHIICNRNIDSPSSWPEKKATDLSKIRLEKFNARLNGETEYPKALSLEFMMSQSTLSQTQRAYVFHQPSLTGDKALTKDEKNAAYIMKFNSRNDVPPPLATRSGEEGDERDVRRSSITNLLASVERANASDERLSSAAKQQSSSYSKSMAMKDTIKRKPLSALDTDHSFHDSESPNSKSRTFRSRSPSKTAFNSFHDSRSPSKEVRGAGTGTPSKESSFSSLHNHAFLSIDHPDLTASRVTSPSSSAIPSPFMRSRATTPSNHGRPASSVKVRGLSLGVNNMGKSRPMSKERERTSRERGSTAPNASLSSLPSTRKSTAKFTLNNGEDSDNDAHSRPMSRSSKPRRNSDLPTGIYRNLCMCVCE